jgi:hypothetical protein
VSLALMKITDVYIKKTITADFLNNILYVHPYFDIMVILNLPLHFFFNAFLKN